MRAEFPDPAVDFDEDGRPYIPPDQVEQRLDEVVGPANWSWAVAEVLVMTADGRLMDPKVSASAEPAAWLVVRGRLTLHLERETFRDGEGSARIQRRRGSEEVIDPGDNLKGASSNAFKKAALRFGIGAYLRDPAVKRRLLARERQAERHGGYREEAARPSGGHRQNAPAAPAREVRDQTPPATRTELEVRLVQPPARRDGHLQAPVADPAGHGLLLIAEGAGPSAILAEAKVGAALRVRGMARTKQGSSEPVLSATEIALVPAEPARPGPGAFGEPGRGEATFTVRLAGPVAKSRDQQSARAVVADADGTKAVLITAKPAVTAILAAQRPGAGLRVVGRLQREGDDLLLHASSVRLTGQPAA